ncbi:MAG: MBL fold metallo-hydrolase [Luminiphilus sp.]|jgi:7,8-dihydropterin-6-yl-methyl-4-(beta-D-ribofuranosyl)aminobenzene 5'-phosphate synthase|nr:MBL fold metallo-hydrolase [Luminiphilus sp.]
MNSCLIRVIIWILCATFSALLQAAPYQVTVLATNISDYGGLGEWSFAALFQSDQDAVLFDTGFKQDTVLHNVLHLDVDLSQVEKVVLSHFHSDHTGGLLILREHFRRVNDTALSQVYVAKGFFDQRVTATGVKVGPGEFARAQDFKEAARALGIRFIEIDEPTEIAPRLWLTGPVPRVKERYNGPAGLFVTRDGQSVPDIIMDDQSLGYLTDKGWLMTSGCGHSGLINTGNVLQSIKDEPIYSIVGGFHLWRADNDTLDRTANWLGERGLGLMMGGHCTGIAAAERIANRLKLPRASISHAAIGSVITPDLTIIRSSIE